MRALAAMLALAGALAAGPAPRWNLDAHGCALAGYDAVAYRDEARALKGLRDLSASAQGAVFLFADEAHRRRFLDDPRPYLPAYGGWCAYAMADGGFVQVDPGSFEVLSGTVHLFYNGWLGDTLKKWRRDEAALKARADAQWARQFPTDAPAKTPGPKKGTKP